MTTALRGIDHDGLSQTPPAEDRPLETDAQITIDAARSAIRVLASLVEDVKEGRTPVCTLQEIGRALVGNDSLLNVIFERDTEIRKLKAALAAVHPNWFEKVCLAKRQDALLRQTRRLLVMTQDALVEEERPFANVSLYVEDMLAELDDYKPAPEL